MKAILINEDMELFHGTSTKHSDSLRIMQAGTWLTTKRWHAFKLAERTSKRDGGEQLVICVEIPDYAIDRVIGRDIPNYRLAISYKPIRKAEYFIEEVLINPSNKA